MLTGRPRKPDPEPEPEYTIELDVDGIRLRQWREQQMIESGIGEFAAMRLSFASVDYRRAAHLKELGMTDDAILDHLLDD